MIRHIALLLSFSACGGSGTGANPGDPAREVNLPLFFTVAGDGMGEGAVYKLDSLERGQLSAPQLVASGLDFPSGLTVDATGAVYVAEKLPAPDGKIKRIARGASNAETYLTGLHNPQSVAVDSFNHIYVNQGDSNRITRSDAAGAMQDFKSSDLLLPRDMAFDRFDRMLLTETSGGSVSRLTTDGEKTVLASGLENPFGIAVDAADGLYVLVNGSGGSDGKLLKISDAGSTTVVENLVNPIALTYNNAHGFFIIEGSPANRIINFSTKTGSLSVVAETGENPYGIAMSPL